MPWRPPLSLSSAWPSPKFPTRVWPGEFHQSRPAPVLTNVFSARILQEQRFNAGAGKFGSAFAQEDGVVYREESVGNNERTGQYSYIGDDGKTYTVKYSAGVNGFRILGGDHIPSGVRTLLTPSLSTLPGSLKSMTTSTTTTPSRTRPSSTLTTLLTSRNICWPETLLGCWQAEPSPRLGRLPSDCQPLLGQADSSHPARLSWTDLQRDSISTSSRSN